MRLASETAAFLKLFINSSALSGVPCISKSINPTIYLLKVHAGDRYRLRATYHAPRPSLSPPRASKHLHEVSSSAEFKCRITFSRTRCVVTYCYASNRRHVTRRSAWAACACAPATLCQPSQRHERGRWWRWTWQKPDPRTPRRTTDLQVMALFSFIPLSLKAD